MAQNPFGFTRSSVQRDHALICADSHVVAPLPGAHGVRAIVLIAPQIGSARFLQYIALLEPGSALPPVAAGRQRFVYVLEGAVTASGQSLDIGGYVYAPSGENLIIACAPGSAPSRLLVIEKPFTPNPADAAPRAIIGREQHVAGSPFMGNDDAILQVLLPDEPAFDMAVNIFTYQPGATLPFVEIHVMEHGMMMIAGAGVYRIGDSWYPVQDGDTIWMASYCPQWFVAMGKTPARYIYYKDVNRDPLLEAGFGREIAR